MKEKRTKAIDLGWPIARIEAIVGIGDPEGAGAAPHKYVSLNRLFIVEPAYEGEGSEANATPAQSVCINNVRALIKGIAEFERELNEEIEKYGILKKE